jgi:micrococcal nuclease
MRESKWCPEKDPFQCNGISRLILKAPAPAGCQVALRTIVQRFLDSRISPLQNRKIEHNKQKAFLDLTMRKLAIIPSIFVLLSSVLAGPAVAELNPLLERSAKYDSIKVIQVLSVDKLLLENNEKVALIGIEGVRPPKPKEEKRDEHGFIIKQNDDPTTSLEQQAFRFAKDLAEGKKVRLEFDAERRNEDGVLVAYVFLPDGRMLNEEFLRQGYAQLRLRAPNMKYADRLRKAYQEARREMRGLQGDW